MTKEEVIRYAKMLGVPAEVIQMAEKSERELYGDFPFTLDKGNYSHSGDIIYRYFFFPWNWVSAGISAMYERWERGNCSADYGVYGRETLVLSGEDIREIEKGGFRWHYDGCGV